MSHTGTNGKSVPTISSPKCLSARGRISTLRRPLLAVTLSLAYGARADTLDDRFALSLGAFLLTSHTTVRADGSAGAGLPVEVGTPISIEKQLGIGDSSSFRLDGYWRFFKRHKIRFMYFDETRSAHKVLSNEIVYRGQIYPAGTGVSSSFDTVVAELAYEYAFMRGEHYELAGSLGIHDLNFKLQLTSTGNINGQQSAHRGVNGQLPVIGVHYVWVFAPRWSVDALFQLFSLKFDQFDGNLQDYNVNIFYMPWKHFGFGAGWNEFRTNVNVSSASYNGNLNWHYGGARIYFRASY